MRPFGDPEVHLGEIDAETASTLLSAATDIAFVVADDGTIVDLATGSDELAKENVGEWLKRRWLDTVTVESRPKVEALLRDAQGSAARTRWRQVNQVFADGHELPLLCAVLRVDLRARNGHAADGRRLLVFGRDLRGNAALQQRLVEAQQAMERDYWQFRQAETRYRHLFQVAGEAVLVVDAAKQKILEANPAAAMLLGDGNAANLAGQTFPVGVSPRSAETLAQMMVSVSATGRADELRAELVDGRGEIKVGVSTYRQERAVHLLVRASRTASDSAEAAPSQANTLLLRLARSAPDCLVVTDLDGRLLSANAAFLELAQLTSEEQVRGETLDRWLGRSGVDLSVLISNLRQRGAVRLFATQLRGEFGSLTDVEISATMVPFGEKPFLGFTIRDVGRRLSGEIRTRRELPRSVGQLTELVGRVPLKDIVSETTDLIEQLCIEAALELTRDNRASAAEMLGLSRQSLYVKLRRYGLIAPSEDSEKERSTPPN